MNKNIKIAKELIRIAKTLVSGQIPCKLDDKIVFDNKTMASANEYYCQRAFDLDADCFGMSTSVSTIFHQSRTRNDYDFSKANFVWKAVGTGGTGNGGWFVPVKPVTPEAKKVYAEFLTNLQSTAPSYFDPLKAMKLPYFYELLPVIDSLSETDAITLTQLPETALSHRMLERAFPKTHVINSLSVPRVEALKEILMTGWK